MAIWTEKEIREALSKGSLKVDPTPKIGEISIDLSVDKVFKVPQEDFSLLMKGYYDLHNPFEQGRFSNTMELLGLDNTLSKEIKPCDGKWKLPPDQHASAGTYMLHYKERFKFNEDIDYSLTKRSSYARCGIAGFSQDNIDGHFYDAVLSFANNVIYEGDAISQLTLYDKGTTVLSRKELAGIMGTDELRVFDETSRDFGEANELTARIINPDDDQCCYPFTSYLDLRLHQKVKAFEGFTIDRKNFNPYDFMPIDLSIYDQKYYARFMIGRTRERVKLGPNYAGLLPKCDPIHHSTICYAPFIKPGSDGVIVTEILPSDPNFGLHHDMIIPLYVVPVKSPVRYQGKFNHQKEVALPW